MRCKICGKSTSANIILKEKRYFVGEGNVCQSCFDRLAVFDYPELDKRAIAKLGVSQ